MPSTNCCDGGVLETRPRFQMACPASAAPPRSPIRGSGLGAEVDRLAAGDVEPGEEVVEWAQAAREASPAASDSNGSLGDMLISSKGGGRRNSARKDT